MRLVYDNNYFNDAYQGIPIGGYNCFIEGLLKGVEVRLGTDFFAQRKEYTEMAEKIVFTGALDEFYNYCYGHLQYRTVTFETTVEPTSNYQGNAVVNYTERSVPYTRVIEHKHFEHFGLEVDVLPNTVVSREYSTEWRPGMEPYYPVNNECNNNLANQYRALAAQEPNVIFGGRLAEYRYYDMAPIVKKVMGMFKC